MEAIGVAIGVVGLSTVLATTVTKIRKTAQDIKYAQDDLHDVEKEAHLFSRLYDDFLDTCDEASSITGNTLKIKKSLISWTENTIEGFQDLFDKVQAVAKDPEYYYSLKAVTKAYYNWIRSKGTLKYLRASLSVARQSMILFTNVRNIEKLNEELVHLRSPLSPAERESIELRRKMTVEERIRIVRRKCRNRHSQRRDIETELHEAVKEFAVHRDKTKSFDANLIREPLLQFQELVYEYDDRVTFQERYERRAYRSQRSSTLPSSESTATTPPRSTQSSNNRTLAPESPPTSPEPTHVDLPIEILLPKKAPTSILNYCPECQGTCTKAEAHNTSLQHAPSEAASQPSLVVPPVVSPPPPKPERNTRGRAASCPQPNRTRLSSQSPMPHRHHPAELDIHAPDDANARTYINPIIQEEDEDGLQDETEERSSLEEPAMNVGPSIWQATGAFEGGIPRGLRIRRQRSRSPQDFW